jgi:uncharacterized protein DUF3105
MDGVPGRSRPGRARATREKEGAATAGTGERQTKAQRKEAARREREEIQRRMVRQRRNRRVGIAGVAVVVVAAIVVLVAVQPGKTEVPSPNELLREAPAAVQAAGCDDVKEIGPYQPKDQDRTHLGSGGLLTMPPVSTYPSVPPTSGPHNPTPLPQGIYSSPPPLDQTIHSLEHGAVIIWYDPSATGEQLDRLKTFYREYRSMTEGRAQSQKIIIAPYDYPDQGEAGRLPAGTQMALAAWHRLQTCAEVSLPVAFDFTAHYVVPPFENEQYRGEAPEPQTAIS